MRITLVAHGFPPHEKTGVENYTAALAPALARLGHRVEVFAPRVDKELPTFSLRREERPGYAVHWIATNQAPMNPRQMLAVPEIAAAFGAFLDRERPEVVHFQHFLKVGIGLVHEARKRRIPTVYTAHDYYPVCHRYTLLRPDLTHCDIRGDSMACSRCDLALSFLNGARGLGDYQMGVLPEQLSPDERAALHDILDDEAQRAGFSIDQMDAAFDVRLELDGLRAQAFAAVDQVIAPTRFLAEELVRGGLERAKIRVLPYGIENADLLALAPARREPASPVRFGYLGGLSKHKGVHVLLEAFHRMEGPGELSIFGDSTDRPYVEMLRRTAAEAGAMMRGPYEREDLPRLYSAIDVVVVPSIWVENYPLVIREAFSARRPVIASRIGALSESIREGVDGLFFDPGDAGALAAALSRCAQEEGLVERLGAAIEPVKGIDAQAEELAVLYAELVAGNRSRQPARQAPPSVRAFQARFENLRSLPTRELFHRALAGLERLQAGLARELGDVSSVELVASALEERSRAQDELRDARAEIEWLRRRIDTLKMDRATSLQLSSELDRALLELREGSRRQKQHLRSAEAYLETKEKDLIDTRVELRSVGDDLQEAASYIRQKEAALVKTENELRDAGAYIVRKEEELRRAEAFIGEKEEELRQANATIAEKEDELRRVGETGQELARTGEALDKAQRALEESVKRSQESEEDARVAAELGLSAIQAQGRLLGRFLGPLVVRLKEIQSPERESDPIPEDMGFAELIGALREAVATLESVGKELEWRRSLVKQLQEEIDWRRGEMRRVRQDVVGGVQRYFLKRTTAGRRIANWREGSESSSGGST